MALFSGASREAGLSGFADRVLRRLTHRPTLMGPKTTLAAIFVCLGAIGWMDYLTGPRMSFVIFYLGPVALAVVWLGRGAGILIALASLIVRFWADHNSGAGWMQEAWLWWNSIASLAVYLVLVWVLDALVRLHRQLEARVRARTADFEREQRRRQEIQTQLLALSTSERRAMGRELHDQLGQHLVGTAMAAQVLAHRLSARDDVAAKEARHIVDLVEHGIAETRQLARGLLLTHLPPERLAAEIEELCASLQQQFPGVECRCEISRPAPQPPDTAAAAQLFRIAQEAMRNALRHSGGRRVELSLTNAGEALRVTVADDGRGVPPEEQRRPGMGLGIMQHRAEHIGASLEISARPGGGTVITCVLPAPARGSA